HVQMGGLSQPYQTAVIENIHRAIEQCGRDIVFSLSAEVPPVRQAEHLQQHVNSWPIVKTPVNDWAAFRQIFNNCREWQYYIGPEHFPDLGLLPITSASSFTEEQKRAVITLWSIVRSPIFLSGDLQQLDAASLALLSNKELIGVHQNSYNNEELYVAKYGIVWAASDRLSSDWYVALFNTSETEQTIRVDWGTLGWTGSHRVRDLWAEKDLGHFEGTFYGRIPPQGAGLYRVYSQ
ncbi:MAG: hypothetical protein AAFP02_18300, partial [Bacteroidota bacterium]